MPILCWNPSLWCPSTHLWRATLTSSWQPCTDWFQLFLWEFYMGTATGWNHPAQISWSLVTHWPTLWDVSTGPLSDLRYRQVRLDWWSTLRMRARQAPLPPTTADCHLDYFPVCMPPRPTVYGWHCGSEIRWHQPDGCQHRVDTSPILTHYAMFIRDIQQWYDKMVLW